MKPARLAAMPPSNLRQGAAGFANVAEAMRKAKDLGVDIAPGIFSPISMSDETWEELIVLPGDDAINRYLWSLGQRDARIWAKATGLEAAAAAQRAGGKVYFQQGRH